MAASRNFASMQDYIVGRLSDDERRAFEDRLVTDPELVRELENSLALREGLQQLRTEGYFARAASRGRSFRLWQPALAAAALAGLALFLWRQPEMTASPILQATPESAGGAHAARLVTAHFTFVSVRGGSTPDLDLPLAGLIEIRAAPATRLTDSRYRVTLIRHDPGAASKPVGILAGLPISSQGYVHCFADASRLSAGSYLLRVEPDATTYGIAAVFPFNLHAAGAQPPR